MTELTPLVGWQEGNADGFWEWSNAVSISYGDSRWHLTADLRRTFLEGVVTSRDGIESNGTIVTATAETAAALLASFGKLFGFAEVEGARLLDALAAVAQATAGAEVVILLDSAGLAGWNLSVVCTPTSSLRVERNWGPIEYWRLWTTPVCYRLITKPWSLDEALAALIQHIPKP